MMVDCDFRVVMLTAPTLRPRFANGCTTPLTSCWWLLNTSKCYTPNGDLGLKQARLFQRPGANKTAREVLQQYIADWHQAPRLCSRTIKAEEWMFLLPHAEVKRKKKDWDDRLARRADIAGLPCPTAILLSGV